MAPCVADALRACKGACATQTGGPSRPRLCRLEPLCPCWCCSCWCCKVRPCWCAAVAPRALQMATLVVCSSPHAARRRYWNHLLTAHPMLYTELRACIPSVLELRALRPVPQGSKASQVPARPSGAGLCTLALRACPMCMARSYGCAPDY